MIEPIPVDFDPWAALLELGADLVIVEGARWVCVHAGRQFASTRTNGGFGIVWADHDGREAVWLAWLAARSSRGRGVHRCSRPSSRDYPRGAPPPAWSLRATLHASVCARRGRWRAFTWTAGPTGLREPGGVVEADQAEDAVLALASLARPGAKA